MQKCLMVVLCSLIEAGISGHYLRNKEERRNGEVKIERIETIYSQGTAEKREDGLIVNPPFFGVVDGFSAPYHYKMQKILFNGMSGGEMVRKIALSTFYSTRVDLPLEKIVLQANHEIGQIQIINGVPIDQAGHLAGASFVFVKLGIETIEIIQGGDCLAIWEYASGEIGVTKNQAYAHVSENLRIIAKLMKDHNDRKEMWVKFCPILSERRQEDINQKTKTGYAVLNGQPVLKECWQRTEVPIGGLKLLLLFTDGFVVYPETAEKTGLASRLISDYKSYKLSGVLKKKRENDAKHAERSYIAQDEATAVVVKFEG